MKKIVLPRLIKWMLLIAIAFLVLMTIMRFVFFYDYRPLHYEFTDNLQSFLLGLNYDFRIVSGMVLFPFLIGNLYLNFNEKKRLTRASIARLSFTVIIMALLMLFMKKGHMPASSLSIMGILFALILVWLWVTKNCNPFENNFSKKVFKTYFFIITVLLVFIFVIDYQYYDYLHQRLNASVMNYTEDAKISMNMVWETYPVVTMLFLIIMCTTILYGLIHWWYKRIKASVYMGGRLSKIIIGTVFTLLLGLGIFGRINQYPLRWSDAFSLNDDFKANLSLNPVQSFLSTLQFRNSSYDIQKVKAYYPLMVKYLNVKNADSVALNYKRFIDPPGISAPPDPNIILVICESFSSYKSSMHSNPLNATPYFNKLSEQGIYFDRCFTPSYGTARGVWAIITGIPDVEYPNTSSRNPAYVNQHSIINDFTGYKKFYFIGGSSSWANIRGLLTNNLSGLHLYEEENFKSESVDVWGISDKRLFLEANKVLRQQQKPFFAIIQTANNHRPYTIPDEDKPEFNLVEYPKDSLKMYGFYSNDELNAFRYTDFSFKKFMEAAQKENYYHNTIFVFVGDHGIKGDAGNMFPKVWGNAGLTAHHVPLLFYSPLLSTPQRISKTCSQLDILPTLAALSKTPVTNTTLGKNLLNSSQHQVRYPHAAFLFDPNVKQIGMVTDEYLFTMNLISGKEEFLSSKDNAVLPDDASTKADREKLKTLSQAYYETAKYMLYHNKKDSIKP